LRYVPGDAAETFLAADRVSSAVGTYYTQRLK
jgi:hypothetical protein